MNRLIGRLAVLAAAFIACSSAYADIAVVVHPENPLSSMSSEEVAAVYLGRNAALRPIDLPERGGLYNWFYYRVTGQDPTRAKIAWAKHFDKIPPVQVTSSAEAMRRVAANKKAIAYVDVRVVDPSVKIVMTIPTPEVLDRMRGQDKEIKPQKFYWW